jgi:hypothetical protein
MEWILNVNAKEISGSIGRIEMNLLADFLLGLGILVLFSSLVLAVSLYKSEKK